MSLAKTFCYNNILLCYYTFTETCDEYIKHNKEPLLNRGQWQYMELQYMSIKSHHTIQ